MTTRRFKAALGASGLAVLAVSGHVATNWTNFTTGHLLHALVWLAVLALIIGLTLAIYRRDMGDERHRNGGHGPTDDELVHSQQIPGGGGAKWPYIIDDSQVRSHRTFGSGIGGHVATVAAQFGNVVRVASMTSLRLMMARSATV